MVNETIIQRFISDLGTITCGEADAIAYFRNSGEDSTECLAALRAMPSIHYVNDKIWSD